MHFFTSQNINKHLSAVICRKPRFSILENYLYMNQVILGFFSQKMVKTENLSTLFCYF